MTEETQSTEEESAGAGEAGPDAERHPTVQEARAMFLENPGLSSVVTDEGNLFRDGSLVRGAA